MEPVPIVDIGPLRRGSVHGPAAQEVVTAIASAAEAPGFFHIVGHGIEPRQIDDVWSQARSFFAQPQSAKRAIMRTKDHSRGYYDRELTKNKRDLKEVFDVAHAPRPDLPDDDPENFAPVDGPNQWPAGLPGFRDTMVRYLASLEAVSLDLLRAFAVALGEAPERLHEHFGPRHTSFIRLNHYPSQELLAPDERLEVTPLGDMALHHHSDAGAFTLLLQDDVGGLQVRVGTRWIDVTPVPEALVVNTGDMMQVWSNDRFTAAVHRVRPMAERERYSIPYFFNPSYDTDYAPLPGCVEDRPHYRTLNWGDFRQSRADGDFADYGTEIQIEQFRVTGPVGS